MSFKEEVEFNCLPGKATRLGFHKIKNAELELLKLSAFYGANASGKSNLIKALNILKTLILEGEVGGLLEGKKFRLSDSDIKEPIEFSIEFVFNLKVFYYQLSIEGNQVVQEFFNCTQNNREILFFKRELVEQKIKITFSENIRENNITLIEVIEKNLLQHNQLLISFLEKLKENDFSTEINEAIEWIESRLIIIFPFSKANILVQRLDENPEFKSYADKLIYSLNTGISRTKIEKIDLKKIDFDLVPPEYQQDFNTLSNEPNRLIRKPVENSSDEIVIVNEDGVVYEKRLLFESENDKGEYISFKFDEQSDGTRRLIEYIPAWFTLQNYDTTFIIDEIERSIHPLLIKELVSKFSFSRETKGQLIFTTHETLLLDQDFFRTDEIWFTQKDSFGISRLYSLAEYKEHNTIDIRKGYLNGRYGGIPFLGDLDSLNWNQKDEG